MIDIIAAVRRAVGTSFPVGIRINATDKLEGGLTEEDALGDDAEHCFTLTHADALRIYEERDAERCIRWLKAFPDVCRGS